MLQTLYLKNVGPAKEMKLEFGSRVNIITGDNGLGKSFILDCVWFALTQQWLGQINLSLLGGQMIRPTNKNQSATITYSHDFKMFTQLNPSNWQTRPDVTSHKDTFKFSHQKQNWLSSKIIKRGDTSARALILQCSAEGEFGIFDQLRLSLGFTTPQVWDGLIAWERDKRPNQYPICNGLIRDWVYWQLENSSEIKQLNAALDVLSPNTLEKLTLGKPTRVKIEDARDIPTLKMPYGEEIPVTMASSGIKRILSLAYLLVWTWQEHLFHAELRQLEPVKQIVLLIDELENHLHPQWQRVILESVLNVAQEIMQNDVEVQIIATTHSPLVMASFEPIFDPQKDAWFDLNLVNGEVTLEKMPFVRRGGAEMWLLSDAFDLPSTGSKEREAVMEAAARVLDDPKITKAKFLKADANLRQYLSETDEFWINWRFIGEKKGWL